MKAGPQPSQRASASSFTTSASVVAGPLVLLPPSPTGGLACALSTWSFACGAGSAACTVRTLQRTGRTPEGKRRERAAARTALRQLKGRGVLWWGRCNSWRLRCGGRSCTAVSFSSTGGCCCYSGACGIGWLQRGAAPSSGTFVAAALLTSMKSVGVSSLTRGSACICVLIFSAPACHGGRVRRGIRSRGVRGT